MVLCDRCMEKLEGEGLCPHCGYDSRQKQNIPYALQPGMILEGKYLIGNVLGQGGFGITYIGLDLALERKVAIKEYFVVSSGSRGEDGQRITWVDDPGSIDHFLKEARRMAMLQEMPQIARVRDVFYANNTAYIVMEYVKGENLKNHLKNRGLMTFPQAAELLLPVIEALGQVHEKGLIHRDISPDNLMMEPQGTLRVLDLGAAGDLNRNGGKASQLVARKGFSPYEQYIEDGKIGPWSDVYALCATLYYCCSGRVIPDAFARVDSFMQTKCADLELEDCIPAPAAEVLQRGMALEAEDRIQSMEELARELRACLEGKRIRRKKKKNGRGWLIACVLALAVAGCGLILGPKVVARLSGPPAAETTEATDLPAETEAPTEPETTEAPTTQPPVTLRLRETMELKDAQLGQGVEMDVLSGQEPQQLQWSSSNTRVADITPQGQLIPNGYGTTRITAEYEGLTAECTVTVTLQSNVEGHFQSNLTGWTLTGCRGTLTGDVVLPKFHEGKPVTEIAQEIFRGAQGMTSVVLPDSVTVIPLGLFARCTGLTSVNIPESVTVIRKDAFKNCTGLTRIQLPEGLTEIQEGAFSGCTGLTRLTLPDSLERIGKAAFEKCTDLTSLTMGKGLVDIDDNAFEGCAKLATVEFGSSLASIGKYTFSGCTSLTELEFPDSLTAIRGFAFYGCYGIRSVRFPETPLSIGWRAFLGCYLTEVTIAEGSNYFENTFPRGCKLLFY